MLLGSHLNIRVVALSYVHRSHLYILLYAVAHVRFGNRLLTAMLVQVAIDDEQFGCLLDLVLRFDVR